MKTLDQIPPVKKGEMSHIARQFLRFSRYWQKCVDKSVRETYFKRVAALGCMLEKELLEKERS